MIADSAFVLFAALTLIGAFGAVALRNVFHNALSLMLALFGVAGLYIFLDAEFLAVMQVIIYIGAISVAIVFAIMLSQPMFRKTKPRSTPKVLRSALLGGALGVALWRVLSTASWPADDRPGASISELGRALLGWAIVPFEAVSLVLLVAIIGALVLAGRKADS